MELKLSGGNYADSGGRLSTVSGAEETAQRIMMKLQARRGGFALMPEYGSRLYSLGGVRPSEREAAARQFIAEALAGESAELRSLSISEQGGGALELKMEIAVGDAAISVQTLV